MKISFITTVYNEQGSISKFIDSLVNQSKLPDEIIIVDGGSNDNTIAEINNLMLKFKKYREITKIIIKKGNRSIGRNEAIKYASGNIIVCSDAGNILEKHWLDNITKPFHANRKIEVVAGYYMGKGKNIFQKCLIPYVLVMPDKVDPDSYLPATRSIAFKKSIWEKAGRFDENLAHNEDFAFANRLKKIGAKIVFAKDAIVEWIPRETYKDAFVMFFRFALGDVEAGIIRTNVILLFTRYILGSYLLFLAFLYKTQNIIIIAIGLLLIYYIWAVKKNYKYVKNVKALYILPSLQLTADIAVISGSLSGLIKRIYKNIVVN